jgi:hypothetical protein
MNSLFDTRVERLLLEKPFESLTFEEQEWVLDQMPEAEYDRLHQLLSKSRAVFREAPAPDPAIRENLLNAIRARQATKPAPSRAIVRMLDRRIPVWQAAALLVVALLPGLYFSTKKPLTVEAPGETVYVHSTDTIYRQVAQPAIVAPAKTPAKRVNVKPRHTVVPATEIPDSLAMAETGRQTGDSLVFPDALLKASGNNGFSATQMKELWGFLEKIH